MRPGVFPTASLCLLLIAVPGLAAACPAGAKCIGGAGPAAAEPMAGGAGKEATGKNGLPGAIRPVAVAEPGYAVGDILPRGEYQVLTNTAWHGLPPSDGTFWYYKVDYAVLKVDARTMEVLDNVTLDAQRVRY